MLTAARSLSALFTSYGLLILANGLFTTLLSLRSKAEGLSTLTIGIVMGVYFLGMFLGARYASRVVARAGHIRSFAAFASLMSMSPLFHVLFIDPVVWASLRLIDGFCLAGLFIVTESWLNARADNKNRGSILAFYMVINFAAYGLSQLLLPLWDVSGFELFALCAVFFSLSLLPLLLTRSDAPLLEMSEELDLGHLLSRAPTGFWGAVCAGICFAAFFSMAPVFAQGLGMAAAEIGYFMAAGVFGGLVLQIPLGKLSDRIERRKIIAGVAFSSAICCAMMVWMVAQEAGMSGLLLINFVFGSLVFTLYSLSTAHANDWCDEGKRVQTSASLILGYGCGAISGPVLASLLIGALGPSGLFIFIGVNCALLSVYSIWQSWSSGRASTKVSFVPQPSTLIGGDELYQAVQEQAEPVADGLDAANVSEAGPSR